MMDGAKRPLGHEGHICGELADDRVDLTNLENLLKSEWREDTMEGFGEHGFS